MLNLLHWRFGNNDHVISIAVVITFFLFSAYKTGLLNATGLTFLLVAFHELVFMSILFLLYRVVYFYPLLFGLPWLLIWAFVLLLSCVLWRPHSFLFIALSAPFALWLLIGFPMSFGYVPGLTYHDDTKTNLLEIGVWCYYCLIGLAAMYFTRSHHANIGLRSHR